MNSRRRFLQQLAAIPAAALALKTAFADPPTRFDLLVVGDSLVWGQGLEEKDKFYTLTKEWLESEAFGRRVNVNLNVKAHSGATINLTPREEAGLRKGGISDERYYSSEINLGYPTITKQLDIARREYDSPDPVGMILVSAGITDLSVASILDPFGDNKKLRADIDRFCRDSMTEMLVHAAKLFPKALIGVLGYYPMISPKTSTKDLFNFTLEAISFPRPLKPIANNLLTKQFFKIIRNRAMKRSKIWSELSELRLREAVAAVNARNGSTRAVFIKAPINEDNTYGTKESLVFRLQKKGRVDDSFYDRRLSECRSTLDEIKKATDLKYSLRFCEMAAIGHPNPAGSRAFAEAIKVAVLPEIAKMRA